MEVTRTYDDVRAGAAQSRYCEANDAPHFAPYWSNDYRCYHCHRNIYAEGGISVEEAGSRLITGCPFCHYSFCE